jgi:hypothetical protein
MYGTKEGLPAAWRFAGVLPQRLAGFSWLASWRLGLFLMVL